jgi:2-polyprenyl-6-hydroxyphenyl methylase/3-demethylubiquinone-9 3-methyltransferase
LDVGCGAGLVAEPMARLGAAVVGIDASARNVAIAERHARAGGLDITYRNALPEALGSEGRTYDIVLSLEVVEHVADLDAFLDACARLLAPGGVMVIGTLNRTLRSFAVAIVGAEYVLRWLPRGTHDWRKFVQPVELTDRLAASGLVPVAETGVVFDPLRRRWNIRPDMAVNYLAAFAKPI